MVSMKDVAQEAGVSIGTVSGVLNGKKTIKPQNYQRVMDAVKKLDYRPNMLARSLRTNITGSIGLIIPDITNPYYPELARGVEDVARKAGVTLFLCNSDRDVEKELGYAQALVQKQVDGIIIAKPHISLEQLQALGRTCKIVLVDGTEEQLREFDLVNVDNKTGAASAIDLLLSYGHRNIAFIGGVIESQSMQYRLDAYRAALAEQGIPYRPEWVRECDYSWSSGREAAIEILSASGSRPTAFFVGNDIMALGVIRGIHDCGLRVPEDISVCGFDDIAMAELAVPALTTVRQPKYEIGRQSARLLLQKIHGEDGGITHKILDTEIVFRGSVACAPSAAAVTR